MNEVRTGEDLYAVLGVHEAASGEEIRVAYRALAQRFHPDHNPNNMAAERRMLEINQAFAVLSAPQSRREYDRRRRMGTLPAQPDACHGAGRGKRPYVRGQHWGMHTGADTPPEFIVRVEPAGFNLVVGADGSSQERAVSVRSDAPYAVRVRALCSPWLAVSDEIFELPAHGEVRLGIGINDEARVTLRGWRDGGVSLLTDDTRVFCPDIRITAIFLGRSHPVESTPSSTPASGDGVQAGAERRASGGWLRRLFGRGEERMASSE